MPVPQAVIELRYHQVETQISGMFDASSCLLSYEGWLGFASALTTTTAKVGFEFELATQKSHWQCQVLVTLEICWVVHDKHNVTAGFGILYKCVKSLL